MIIFILSLWAFSNKFWHGMPPKLYFFNFLKNLSIFLEFSITHRDEAEQNDNFYFLYFSAFCNLFWLEMKPHWYCLIFWFFGLFVEFFIARRIGAKRNDNFYFISFSAFSNLFWLEMKSQWYFLIFWFFFLFFWNFLLPVELERNGETIFIFSLSRPFQTYFGLKRSHNRVF